MKFLSYLLSGISLGSIYAIIALGYTMVYGIAKMLNFAHGDIIMVGGYVAFTAMTALNLPASAAVLLSVLFCTALGVIIEAVAYKPLRGANSLAVLITAIGVSYLLQNLALLIFGANPKSFRSVVPIKSMSFANGQLVISGETVAAIAVCFIIMVALTSFINKTRAGQAMLAVAEDRGAATLMGINVNATVALTFAIGSALAAIAGVLLCSAYPTLTPTTGAMPGIKAFVAAVLGGIGSIPGALIGGLLLGVLENLSKAYLSSKLSDAIVFSVLILVLVVRPTGILGKQNIGKESIYKRLHHLRACDFRFCDCAGAGKRRRGELPLQGSAGAALHLCDSRGQPESGGRHFGRIVPRTRRFHVCRCLQLRALYESDGG